MGADRRRCADGDAIDDRRRRCFYCSFCFAADAHDRSHDHRDGEVLMFRQTYLSDAIPYRKPEDWAGIPNGIGLQSLYNGYLITPPRLYAEELGASSVTAMLRLQPLATPTRTWHSFSREQREVPGQSATQVNSWLLSVHEPESGNGRDFTI